MPITSSDPAELQDFFRYEVPDAPEQERDIDTSQVLGAAFRQENSLSALIAYNQGKPSAPTQQEHDDFVNGKFDPLELVKGTKYDTPDNLSHVAKARSQRELDWIYQNFDRMDRDAKTLEEASATQNISSTIAAGILDPILAPTLVIPAVRGSLATKSFGTAAVAAGTVSVSEGILHGVQPKRTAEQTAFNIGSASLFGAILGPWAGKLSVAERKAIMREIEQEANSSPIFVRDSTGAQRVEEAIPDEFLHNGFSTDEISAKVAAGEMSEQDAAIWTRDRDLSFNSLKFEKGIKALSWMSPVLRVAVAKNTRARKLLESLVEDSFIRTKNQYGHTSGPAAETVIRGEVTTRMENIHTTLGDEWKNYTKATKGADKDIRSFDEFAEEVGRAGYMGDKHPNEFVAKAAKGIREFDDSLEKTLIKEKMIEIDDAGNAKIPFGDESYSPRIWKFDKIINDRHGFKTALVDAIKKTIKDPIELAKFEQEANLRVLRNELNQVVDKITGSPTGHFNKDIAFESGYLKGRTLNVASIDVQDWIVHDVRAIKDSYYRSVIPQVELNSRFGSIDLEDQLQAIRREYDDAQAVAKTPKEIKKIENEAHRVMRDLNAMKDIILGQYRRPEDPTAVWSKIGHRIRAHNFLTSLGGMTVASIPDVGNVVARMGLKPFFGGLYKMAFNLKGFNLARAQAKKMAAGLDVILNTRAQTLMMMDDTYKATGAIDRAYYKAGHNFSKITGMSYWNAGWKQFAGVIFNDDMGRLVHSTKKMTKREMTKMASAGIDKTMWTRIKKQWKKHGDYEEDFHTPNVEKWDDREAANTFASSMLKEVDSAIVTPSAGDLPLVSRGDVGKLIFQFKAFPLTAQNRIMIAGIQRFGAGMSQEQFAGFMMMMTLGVASWSLKEIARGKDPMDSSPEQIALNGVNASGFFGYMSDMDAMIRKATQGKIKLIPLGDATITKYRARSVLADVLGPTYGTAADVVSAVGAGTGAIAGEGIDESQIKAMRRLLPYQNLIYIRRILDQMQEELQ